MCVCVCVCVCINKSHTHTHTHTRRKWLEEVREERLYWRVLDGRTSSKQGRCMVVVPMEDTSRAPRSRTSCRYCTQHRHRVSPQLRPHSTHFDMRSRGVLNE